MFAGGNVSAAQPYAELLVDEYRIGETYADVTPIATNGPRPPVAFLITNTTLVPSGVILSGVAVRTVAFIACWPQRTSPTTQRLAGGQHQHLRRERQFQLHESTTPGAPQQFFRLLLAATSVGGIAPSITTQPTNQSVVVSGNTTFSVAAGYRAACLSVVF